MIILFNIHLINFYKILKYLYLSFIFKFNPATHFCFLSIWLGNACVAKDAPLEFEKPHLVAVNTPVSYFSDGTLNLPNKVVQAI